MQINILQKQQMRHYAQQVRDAAFIFSQEQESGQT